MKKTIFNLSFIFVGFIIGFDLIIYEQNYREIDNFANIVAYDLARDGVLSLKTLEESKDKKLNFEISREKEDGEEIIIFKISKELNDCLILIHNKTLCVSRVVYLHMII